MHNVEGALFEDLAAASDKRVPPALARLVAQRSTAIEQRIVASVDQLWVCSAPDGELLRVRYPDHAPLALVPNTWPGDLAPPVRRNLSSPLLLFIGTLGYSPNAEAARWLAAELLPAVRDAGLDARLRIVGGNAPDSLGALGPAERVELTGEVAELGPHLAAAALTPIPLTVGSGTRFKILEAFAAGLPVVSTAKGIEGIEATSGEHYLRAEGLDQFVAAICELCASPELHARLARNAQELLVERYSSAALAGAIAAALGALSSRSARRSSPSSRRSSATPAA
jgi:glycosyltransferase involved in cell wall biosynthesis